MSERLSARAANHKEDRNPPRRLSYQLSSLSLTRADIRAYARIYGTDFDRSAEELMRLGISGRQIEIARSISAGQKMPRTQAAEKVLRSLPLLSV